MEVSLRKLLTTSLQIIYYLSFSNKWIEQRWSEFTAVRLHVFLDQVLVNSIEQKL